MSRPDPDTTVRRFLDGDLSDDEVREALHRIADDPDARSLLQFELRMTQDLAASGTSQPSAEFTRSTMEQLEETEATSSPQTRLREWWTAVTQPLITIPVRPVHALATLALVLAAAWFAWPSAAPDPAPVAVNGERATSMETATDVSTQQTVWTRFVYSDDDADSVAVAGDFSQWRPIPLSPRTVNGETVWTGLVPVPRGKHEYQFVIDGDEWVPDPLAPTKEDDGFGAKNSVLKL